MIRKRDRDRGVAIFSNALECSKRSYVIGRFVLPWNCHKDGHLSEDAHERWAERSANIRGRWKKLITRRSRPLIRIIRNTVLLTCI